MKKILLFVAVILLSQNVKAYDVFPDSNSNVLNIKVSNTSSVFPIQQVKISKQGLPNWVTGLNPAEVNFGTLAANQSATATFTFNIAANAPTNASEDMVLQVNAATGDAWSKRVNLRVINPNGSISGRITAGSGATVQAVVGSVVTRTVTANADGNYTIADLSPGTYTVTVSRTGYASTSTTTPIRVNTSAAVTGIDLTLTSLYGSISGKVNGSSEARIQVVGPVSRDTTTNMSGEYTISDLPPGTYTLTASQSGYASTSTSKRIDAGTVISGVDFTLIPFCGDISGKISAPGWDDTTYGTTILAEGPGTKSITNMGNYTISNLITGTYTVTAFKSNYSSTPASRTVVVTTGKTTTGVDFTLIYKYGIVTGKVNVEGAITPSGVVLTITGPATKTSTLGITDSLWYTIKELPAGKYKITASKAGYVSIPSSQTVTIEMDKETKGVNFVLINKPPQSPALNNPGDKTTVSTFGPTLKWNKSDGLGTIKYRLQVADNTLFQSPVINTEIVNTEYIPTLTLNFSNGRTYYWQVCASNEVGTGSWSTTWAFTIKVLPGKPVLISPSNSSTIASFQPSFDWEDTLYAASYSIQADNNSDFSSPEIDKTGLTSSSYNHTNNLSSNTKYYWRVQASNAIGSGDWSDKWNFTTPSLPSVPTLSSPSNDTTISNTDDISLSWNSVNNATSYQIQVAKSNSFSSMIVDRTEYSTSYTAWDMDNNTTYYWRVKAKNNVGESGWSSIWLFKLNLKGTIKGDVDGPGSSQSGATVWVTGPSVTKNTTTGWLGGYELSDLPPGEYTVSVYQAGYTSDPASQQVTVKAGETTSWVDFKLLSPYGEISGNIDDGSYWDQAQSGAIVTAQGAAVTIGPSVIKSVSTNWVGGYTISGLPAGDYTVSVYQDGYTSDPVNRLVTVRAGGTVKNVDFTLKSKTVKAMVSLSSPSTIRNAPAYQSYAATLRKGAPPIGTITEIAPMAVIPVLKTGETTVHLSTTRDVSEIPSLSYTMEGVNTESQKIALTGAGSSFEGKMYIESTTPEGTATFHYCIIDEAGSSTQIEYGKEFVIDTTIYPEEGGESSNRDGSLARLPAGALKCPVNIRIIDAKSSPDQSNSLDKIAPIAVDRLTLTCLPRTKRQFSAQVDGKEEEELPMALKMFTVCLPYLDVDDDGLVDNVSVLEEKLRIVYEDADGKWRIADKYAIDMAANRVTAQVTAFTKYMLSAIVDITTMDKIISYPNPWHTDRGGLIKISYIPANSQPMICIYNIAGELVRTLHEGREIVATDRGYMEAEWDGRNDSGDSVASGIYLYLIKCNRGEKTGKMGVIR